MSASKVIRAASSGPFGPEECWYLLQFLASVLLTYVLVRQQNLQELLHGFMRGFCFLLLKLSTTNLTAECIHLHWDAVCITAISIRNAIDRNLG